MGKSLLVRDLSWNPYGFFDSVLLKAIFFALLSDVIGVVQSVSPTMSIRRKSDNESIAKRDITIADER